MLDNIFDLQRFAVIRDPEEGSLTIKVATGASTSGGVVYSNRTVNYLSPSASDANVLSFATSYAGLQAHELGDVIRTTKATLVEDD